MAEPVKVKFEYKNPENVHSEVPGEQKLREDVSENGNEIKDSKMRRNSGAQTPATGPGRLDRRLSKDDDKPEENKTKTKIPVSRLRQTIEKVKAERREAKEKKNQESNLPIRRSSIPKATSKAPSKPTRKSIPATKNKPHEDKTEATQQETTQTDEVQSTGTEPALFEPTVTKTDATDPIATEDEFDKLYEEVVHSLTPINLDVSLLNPKVDDPEKLESKFEEIIHDYDENRVQPIDVEKIKKSKIPFLKRKSQQDIDVRGDRSGKMIAARDKLRMRRSSAKSDDVIGGKVDNNIVVNIIVDKSNINTQDNASILNTIEIANQGTEHVTQIGVKDEEIEINETLDDTTTNNEVIDDPKQSIDTTEVENNKVLTTNLIEGITDEPVDIENKSYELNDESVETSDLVAPVLVQNGYTNTTDSFTEDIELLNDGTVTVESELREQGNAEPIISIDIETDTNNTQLEEKFKVNVSQIEDTFIEPSESPPSDKSANIEITTEEIKEEKIYKGSIIIGIPVFDSQVQENGEKTDGGVLISEVPTYTPYDTEDRPDAVAHEDSIQVEMPIFVSKDLAIEESTVDIDIIDIPTNAEQCIEAPDTGIHEGSIQVEIPALDSQVQGNIEESLIEIDVKDVHTYAESLPEAVIHVSSTQEELPVFDSLVQENIENRDTEINFKEIHDYTPQYTEDTLDTVIHESPVQVEIPIFDAQVEDKTNEDITEIDVKDVPINSLHYIEHSPDPVIYESYIQEKIPIFDSEAQEDTEGKDAEIKFEEAPFYTPDFTEDTHKHEGSVQAEMPVFDSKEQEWGAEIYARGEPIYSPYYTEDTSNIVLDKVAIAESEPENSILISNADNNKIVVANDEQVLIRTKNTKITDTKLLMKEKDGSVEDIAKLRGKVGRMISNIDAHEPVDSKRNDIVTENELPKPKSVLSKIAMFERNDTRPTYKPKILKTNLPKLQTINIQTEEKVHIHTPLVIGEVFKPFTKIDSNNDVNKVEITKNDDDAQIYKAEMAVIESPENLTFEVGNTIEINSRESKISEEVLPAVLREYKLKERNKEEDAVVVPKFVPVKDVLKRYESISTNNHSSKTKVNIPKVRPISDIIKTLKPDSNPRSLERMFSHQSESVTEILKDLPIQKDKSATNNTEELKKENDLSGDSKVLNDRTKPSLKSYRSRDREYKTMDSIDNNFKTLEYIQDYHSAKAKNDELKKAKSLAELDIGDAVKGKVNRLVVRMNSLEKENKFSFSPKEIPIKRSVSEKIALFERKITPMKPEQPQASRSSAPPPAPPTAELRARIADLSAAKERFGSTAVPSITLADGTSMPAIALGTAMLDPGLVYHVVCAAIELGYRAIDTAFIYGNERAVGEAIRDKINDGTVTRGDLFIMSKLWSTFHRRELVAAACDASLSALGLTYFDLYMIHNPMSFKEGGDPIPKIATVLQYSESDYLDAWFGMEALGYRARALGLSNFNAAQVQRVLDRARIKPVVNQVECHPYLSQKRLGDFCSERNITLSCYGVLGSKGTPQEYKNGHPPAIDDPLVQVMASGLNVSPAQLLIRYQLQCGRQVVVKSSSAANLWSNLQVSFNLTGAQFDAIRALNRNKRNFTFKGMGDTHKNYPFNEPF